MSNEEVNGKLVELTATKQQSNTCDFANNLTGIIFSVFMFVWYLLGFVFVQGWWILLAIFFPVYPFYLVVKEVAKLYFNIT